MSISRPTTVAVTCAATLGLSMGASATAWADQAVPSNPSATPSHDSMSDTEMDSMPGMDHDATPMPDLEHEHTHGSGSGAARPRALVLGGFAVVNGAGVVTGLALRRRGRDERDRKQTARQRAGTPAGGRRTVEWSAADTAGTGR